MASTVIDRLDVDSRRQWQEYFDRHLQEIGERAPSPISGQSTADYVRETCRAIKRQHLPQNHPLYLNYRGLPDNVLSRFAPQLVAAVKVEAVNPANFEPGEIRLIPWTDPQTGRKENRFYGQEHFTKFMGRPGRRVISFTTDRGRFDASGRPLQ